MTTDTTNVIDHGMIEGLEAREVVSTAENTKANQLHQFGNNFRFQLGKTIQHVAKFRVVEADGRAVNYELPVQIFQLVAFGPSFFAAAQMLRNKPTEALAA